MDISKLKGQVRFSIPHGKRFIVLVAIAAVLGVVALFTYVDFGSAPISKLKSASPGQPLADLLEQMEDYDINQIPVVEQGKLLGLVSREQVLRFLRTRAKLEE